MRLGTTDARSELSEEHGVVLKALLGALVQEPGGSGVRFDTELRENNGVLWSLSNTWYKFPPMLILFQKITKSNYFLKSNRDFQCFGVFVLRR